MNITVECSVDLAQPVEVLIAGVTVQGWQHIADDFIPWGDNTILSSIAEGEFSGKTGQSLLLRGDSTTPRLLIVGLGNSAKLSGREYRNAAALAVQQLRRDKLTSWAFDLSRFPQHDVVELTTWLLDGAQLECYRFERYKKDSAAEQAPTLCCIFCGMAENQLADVTSCIKQRQIINAGVYFARDLVNEPGNVKKPEYLAAKAWQLAAELENLICTVFGQAELQRQGFGALLAVAQGSDCEPRFIVLEYNGAADGSAPVAVVGKGVTFDSGGISLKPGEGMDQMKMDMAGGATVLATMEVIAKLKLPINVVGVVPAVENMPSGGATRPGDIVTSLSGQTIEVLNTDAEGRLILADALTWVGRKKPVLIVDLATLTGACILALGHHVSAVLGNDAELIGKLRNAGDAVGERLWELPLFDDYSEQIKSTVADMKNIGGRPAGTITAAAFLQKFVDEKTAWAHIDIAGTAWEEKGRPGQPVGGTGIGVRLLVEFLCRCCNSTNLS